MRKLLFICSFVGLLAGGVVAYVSAITQPPLPPAFNPPTNPYPNGIYAEGMLESDQPSGENINVYPEVSGTVTHIPGRRRPGGEEGHGSAGASTTRSKAPPR